MSSYLKAAGITLLAAFIFQGIPPAHACIILDSSVKTAFDALDVHHHATLSKEEFFQDPALQSTTMKQREALWTHFTSSSENSMSLDEFKKYVIFTMSNAKGLAKTNQLHDTQAIDSIEAIPVMSHCH